MPAFEMCQAIGRNCLQRTAAAVRLYPDSSVRTIERGIISAGCDPKTGDHRYPEPGLVRLTIPRRVYTQAHRDVTAEAVTAVYEDRHNAKELKRPYEDRLEYLRFSQARFELPPGCLRREHPQHGTQKTACGLPNRRLFHLSTTEIRGAASPEIGDIGGG